MSVYTAIRDNNGVQEAKSVIGRVQVTVLSGQLTGTAAHGFGKTPSRVGRPNPNRDDGYNARASASATLITVTCEAPVSADTIFDVDFGDE